MMALREVLRECKGCLNLNHLEKTMEQLAFRENLLRSSSRLMWEENEVPTLLLWNIRSSMITLHTDVYKTAAHKPAEPYKLYH
jgi:hypothetical protein